MGDRSTFKLSKIEIIVPTFTKIEEEIEETGPKEVPIFDQTMSLLQMIKDKKVNFYRYRI